MASTSAGGKGSKQRPSSVPTDVFGDNHDRIFKKKKEETIGDACRTKTLTVSIQENGIIRNAKGRIIARLTDDVPFDSIHLDS